MTRPALLARNPPALKHPAWTVLHDRLNSITSSTNFLESEIRKYNDLLASATQQLHDYQSQMDEIIRTMNDLRLRVEAKA